MNDEPSEIFVCTECSWSFTNPADADYHEMDTSHSVETVEL